MNADVIAYLEQIDATLRPFGGRFIVHGGDLEVLEGTWPGSLIVIEFTDRDTARAWYRSAAYQSIVQLRTNNSVGEVVLVDGVGPEHRATDILSDAVSP
jgi:uncharacterized protein (DUF1330 family)